jgi:hypothetical protein
MSKDAKKRLVNNSEAPTSRKRDQETRETPLLSEFEGKIGRHLRLYYNVRLAEPLPEKFTRLLIELAKSNGQS